MKRNTSVKIPNKTIQSLLSFCLSPEDLDSIKEKIESTRHRELAMMKEVEPLSFYKPLTQPCYCQHQDTSRILSSDGNRILCYEFNTLNIPDLKDPVFISLNKKQLTEAWMLSVLNNESRLDLYKIILTGEKLPPQNIFEIAVDSQLTDIKKLIWEDTSTEVNAHYLLDAINAAIASSEEECPKIRICTEGGKTLLFQGDRIVGAIMGINQKQT